MVVSTRSFFFQGLLFRFHVKLQGHIKLSKHMFRSVERRMPSSVSTSTVYTSLDIWNLLGSENGFGRRRCCLWKSWTWKIRFLLRSHTFFLDRIGKWFGHTWKRRGWSIWVMKSMDYFLEFDINSRCRRPFFHLWFSNAGAVKSWDNNLRRLDKSYISHGVFVGLQAIFFGASNVTARTV